MNLEKALLPAGKNTDMRTLSKFISGKKLVS